jgi:hypothetical protein
MIDAADVGEVLLVCRRHGRRTGLASGWLTLLPGDPDAGHASISDTACRASPNRHRCRTRVLLWVDSCCVMGTPVPLDICTQHLTQQGWMTLTIVPAERQAFLARVAARDPSLANVLRAEVDLDERPVASTASHLTLQSPQWEIPTAVAPVGRQPANTVFPADSILYRRDSNWIFPSDSILRRGGNDWIFPAGSILNHNP